MLAGDFIAVSLKRRKVKKYSYYFLYWPGPNGKPCRQSLGSIKKLSRRQANVLRSRKEQDLNSCQKKNIGIVPTISNFLSTYLESRKTELAPGTLGLHQQTKKYLLSYFGETLRIDQITKSQARSFKTSLANGELVHVNKRQKVPGPVTVDIHIRNAKTIFNRAIEDDFIAINPFGKLSTVKRLEKRWHYVTPTEYHKLIEASPNRSWRLLIALCRLAGLRRGEALNLDWNDIDFGNHLIRIIAKEDWKPKDREPRTVPIFRELYNLLLEAHENAKAGQVKVIEGIVVNNSWRDFQIICKRAGVPSYSKPFHTLRKNCITDWAAGWPAHVVKEWAGHSDLETTNRHYLQVSKMEYNRAANANLFEFAQKFAQLDENKEIDKIKENV